MLDLYNTLLVFIVQIFVCVLIYEPVNLFLERLIVFLFEILIFLKKMYKKAK